MSLSKLFRTLKPHLSSTIQRGAPHEATTDPASPKQSRTVSANAFNNRQPKKEYVSFSGQPIPHRKLAAISNERCKSTDSHVDVHAATQSQAEPGISDEDPLGKNAKDTINKDSISGSKLPPVSNTKGSLTGSEHTINSAVDVKESVSSSHSISAIDSNTRSMPSPVASMRQSILKELQSSSRSNLKEESPLLHLVQPPTTSLQLTLGRNNEGIKKQERVSLQPHSLCV